MSALDPRDLLEQDDYESGLPVPGHNFDEVVA